MAALPVRRSSDGELSLLLVTSRDTGRWIIPKGWPMKRQSDHKAAAVEAKEEAGVTGSINRKPIGHYSYFKRLAASFELVEVAVYLLTVERELETWLEDQDRERRWVSLEAAAEMVLEPGLIHIILQLREGDDNGGGGAS